MHSPLSRRTLKYCLAYGLAGGLASIAYTAIGLGIEESWLHTLGGFCIGAAIAAILTWFELEIHRTYLKKLPLGAAFLISLAAYALAMAACISTGVFAFGMAAEPFSLGALVRLWATPDFNHGMAFGWALTTLFVFSMLTGKLVGGRVLLRLFLGRYHTPFEEDLIFLFMDLRGSTEIAERIGAPDFMRLLNDFFTDVAHATELTGGEIHKYVGDEAIVVWKPGKRGVKQECARCVTALREQIRNRTARYRQRYGLVPQFRAALHRGRAVTGEIGYFRMEIAHMCDVINTTARILEKCRELGEDFLASAEGLAATSLPAQVTATPVGTVSLRGKETPVTLYALREEA